MPNDINVRGFLSYVHADNETFGGIAEKLKGHLEGYFEASTGRKLELFLDHGSIGWGTNWRDKINASVEGATVFMPVVSLRYFESEACRQELFAYYDTAGRLGVKRLILPVVIAGSDGISATDERREVRIVEELQYRNIEDAVIAGYDSPEWRSEIRWMAQQLRDRLEEVESTLAAHDEESVVLPDEPAEMRAEDFDVADASGRLNNFNVTVQKVGEALNAFGDDASAAFAGQPGGSQSAQRAFFTAAADKIRNSAAEVGRLGRKMEGEASQVDSDIRILLSELDAIDIPQATEQSEDLRSSLRAMNTVGQSVSELGGLIEMMRLASLANVSLRKALTPAIDGLNSIAGAARIMKDWQAL